MRKILIPDKHADFRLTNSPEGEKHFKVIPALLHFWIEPTMGGKPSGEVIARHDYITSENARRVGFFFSAKPA